MSTATIECPKGGQHEPKTEGDEVFCGKCYEPMSAPKCFTQGCTHLAEPGMWQCRECLDALVSRPQSVTITTPFASVLPPPSADELDTLRTRVDTEGGIHDSVLLSEAGEVLDGHHRLEINPNAPRKVILGSGTWSDAEKRAFVARANLGRRNLSAEQIRESCLPIARDLKREGKTQEDIARRIGIPRGTIARWLGQENGSVVQMNNVSAVDCRVKIPKGVQPAIAERVTAGESAEKVAGDLKVSARRIRQIVSSQAGEQAKRVRRQDAIAVGSGNLTGERIYTGDMSRLGAVVADDKVDLFLTDPPYIGESIEAGVYSRLAELAAVKLKPGGLCIAYAAHYFLPRIIEEMSRHLTYWWIFSIEFKGPSVQVFSRNIQNSWRPVVAFCKPPLSKPDDWMTDHVDGGGRDKAFHDWGQAEAEADYFISKLTYPGQIVVDPFCGGGTVPAVAKRLGRNWFATEINEETAAIARQRLNGVEVAG